MKQIELRNGKWIPAQELHIGNPDKKWCMVVDDYNDERYEFGFRKSHWVDDQVMDRVGFYNVDDVDQYDILKVSGSEGSEFIEVTGMSDECITVRMLSFRDAKDKLQTSEMSLRDELEREVETASHSKLEKLKGFIESEEF